VNTVGTCGDVLTLTALTAGDPLTVNIAIPGDSSEVWTFTATDQEYGAVTGGRSGDPIELDGTTLPALALNDNGIGLSSTGTITDTAGLTHGISYTATRTSPSPMTCTNVAYWTHPSTTPGPTPENPAARPNSAPALTGTNTAHAGTHDVLVQFDQEMLATAQGIPAAGAFDVVVGGSDRTISAIAVNNDTPAGKATLDLTLTGDALAVGPTLTVAYHAPTSPTDPALQDVDGHRTLLIGTTTIAVS
jgi:hypothetical protein